MSLIWAAFFQLWHLGRGDCWNDIPRTFAAPGKEAHDVWLSKLVEWRDHHLKYHGCYLKWKKVAFCYFFLEAFWCLKTWNHHFHPYLWHLVAADFEKSQDLHRRGVWGSVSQLDAHFICSTTSSPLWQAWRNLSLTCREKPMFTLICLKWSLISCTVILKHWKGCMEDFYGGVICLLLNASQVAFEGFCWFHTHRTAVSHDVQIFTVLNASSVKLALQVSLWWGVDGGSLPGWSHTTLWRYRLSTDLAHLHQHWYWWEEPWGKDGACLWKGGCISGPSSAGISSTTFVPCRVDWLDLPTSLSSFTREVSEFYGVSCPAGRQAHFLKWWNMKKPNKYSQLLWVWMFCIVLPSL